MVLPLSLPALLLSLQLVELDHQVVDILQAVDFVESPESFNEGLLGDKKDKYADFEIPAKELNVFDLILIFLEEVEVGVAEVCDEYGEIFLLVVAEGFLQGR